MKIFILSTAVACAVILFIDSSNALPMAWVAQPEAGQPRNPFSPTNTFGHQHDIPLPPSNIQQQSKPANNLQQTSNVDPAIIGFNDGDNAANWPTPPPIGGLQNGGSQFNNFQSSSTNFQSHSPGLQSGQPLPVSNNVAFVKPVAFDSNLFNNAPQNVPFNPDLLITPPPIPGFDKLPITNNDNFQKSQGAPHFAPQNSFPKKNPFDSLPVRSRSRRFNDRVFSANPNLPLPSNNNPNMMAQNNFAKTPGEARFLKANPPPNLSNQANPTFPDRSNPGMPNPSNPAMGMNSLQNPNKIPTSFQSNPALQSAFLPPMPNNQLQPPVMPPSALSGFPNTNGEVVLDKDPSLPDIGEQKTLLPSQMANPNDLIMSQNSPLREHKLLLPSQIAALNKSGR